MATSFCLVPEPIEAFSAKSSQSEAKVKKKNPQSSFRVSFIVRRDELAEKESDRFCH